MYDLAKSNRYSSIRVPATRPEPLQDIDCFRQINLRISNPYWRVQVASLPEITSMTE